jgi:phosphoribosylglycinamide formyltransferase-1
MSAPTRIVVLISGRGSNFEALARAALPATFVAVISNEPEARGLRTAAGLGIATCVIDHRPYPRREDFEAALAAEIDRCEPDLVVLAGFMRVLTPGFVARYDGRCLNIHPSLLPSFHGLHTHRRALESGVRIHGCTVHFVTPSLDAGPIVIQAAVPVLSEDTEETLAARVLAEEHRVYPQAVRWFCEGRLSLTPQGKVRIKGEPAGRGVLVSPPVASAAGQV